MIIIVIGGEDSPDRREESNEKFAIPLNVGPFICAPSGGDLSLEIQSADLWSPNARNLRIGRAAKERTARKSKMLMKFRVELRLPFARARGH